MKDFLKEPRTFDGAFEVSFQDACISPVVVGKGEYGDAQQDAIVDKNTAVLKLDYPGPEVSALAAKSESESGIRFGIREWVVTTKFKGEGPRDVEVRRRDEVLGLGSGRGRGKL